MDEITYTITRKKIKNINLRIRHDGSVAVSAPINMKDEIIREFILSKSKWILEHSKKTIPDDGCFLYLGNNISLSALTMPLKEYYMQQSQTVLSCRFDILCTSVNIRTGLHIKPLKGKYGYYDKSSNTVCLNAALIAVPIECIDYVIIHELIHTKYLNHGKGFHNLLDTLVPDNKNLRQLLSQYVIFNLFD